MTFTIYQEGRLELSNIAKQDKTQSVGTTTSSTPSLQEVSYDQNLPISSFSAIGDDGDDALPQNTFDNDLDTKWSHDSMGSWIIVDVGTIRIAEYDLTPINITFTQAMKKISVKSGIDDPMKNGMYLQLWNFHPRPMFKKVVLTRVT